MIGTSHGRFKDFSCELTKNSPLHEISTSRGEMCRGLDWCVETTGVSTEDNVTFVIWTEKPIAISLLVNNTFA